MKLLPFSVAGLLSMGLLASCDKKTEASDLEVSMPGASAYVLPTTLSSCNGGDNDIASRSFSYRNITLTWKNTTDQVYVVAINMNFKSPSLAGGEFKYTIAGDELSSVFASLGVKWNGLISAAGSVTNSCALKAGALSVVSGSGSFTVKGTISVIGIQRNADGEEKPVRGTSDVELIYGGF